MKHFFILIAFLLLANCVKAQSFTDYVSGTTTVSTLLSVTLSNNTATASFNNLNAYASGVTTNNFSTIAIKSNVLWLLGVQAQNANFTPMTQGASSSMPASILSIRRNGTSTFTPLSTTGVTLKTGSRGNALTSGNTFGIDMNFNPGFNYPGGIYTLGLLYTLTNQ